MLKSILIAAAFGTMLLQPAFADDAMKSGGAMKSGDSMMKCDDASMMKMQSGMEAMKDPAMKEMAMKQMGMAKDAMKANKMDDCKMHMGEAMKSMEAK